MSAVRQAPPVSVVCRGRGWRVAQALLVAAAAASITTWALQRAGVFEAATLFTFGALAAALAGCLAWRRLHREPVTLRWDGQHWTLGSDPVTPAVMLDLDDVLLLRTSGPPGRTDWLAATRGDAGASWHALRVAVYARPRAAA